MGEIAFVVVPGTPVALPCCVAAILAVVIVWLLSRRIRRWFGRSLKARQDLARATADMADRLERIERKLEERTKAER